VYADTLIVVGVAVNSKGERVPGALVRLYATETKLGGPLAEDRTSDRGVFSLYRSNIAGDIGDVYVVYMGDAGKAEPLKVALGNSREGRVEARTNDLVVLTIPVNASVTEPQAVAYIAAVTNTEGILAKAGAKSQADADAAVQQQTVTVLAQAKVTNPAETAAAKDAIGKRLIDNRFKAVIEAVRPTSAITGNAK
jgi:hypothetical protein